MAKPNYAFAKRQRDLAKQQKKQEKEKRKSAAKNPPVGDENPPAESMAGVTPSESHQRDSTASGGQE